MLPHDLHGALIAHVFWVGSVLHSSRIAHHSDRYEGWDLDYLRGLHRHLSLVRMLGTCTW